jgi:hypothetical protein
MFGPPETLSKLAAVEAVAAAWNRAGVPYAVVHGLDDYPAAVGRDLDVLVRAGEQVRARDVARRALAEAGFTVAQPPPLWGERLVAAINGESADLMEVHLITEISWRNVLLAASPRPTARTGPFAVDPWAAFAKRVLMPLLAGKAHKLDAEPARLALTPEERTAAGRALPGLADPGVSRRVLDALDSRDYRALAALAPALGRTLVRRAALRHPVRSARLVTGSVVRRLRQPFNPCAPVVALVGGSPERRAAMVESLRRGDRMIFTDVVVRRLARPEPGPGAAATHWAAHWARLLALWARGIALGLGRDRIDSSRQRLVVYDGWPAEAADAPARYGLASARGAVLCRRVPRPDVLVVLGDGEAASVPCGVGAAPDAGATDPGAPGPDVVRLTADAADPRGIVMARVARAFVRRNPCPAP